VRGQGTTRTVSILERAEGPHWAQLLLSIDDPPSEETEWVLQRRVWLGWRRIRLSSVGHVRQPLLKTAGHANTSTRWEPGAELEHTDCIVQDVYTSVLPDGGHGDTVFVSQLAVGPPPPGASHVVVRFGPEQAPQTRIVRVGSAQWSFGAWGVPHTASRYPPSQWVPIPNDEPLELEYIDPWGRRLPPVVVDPAAAEPCPRTNRVLD
jgi:hypothetical protein